MSDTSAMTREQGYDGFLTAAETDLRSAQVEGVHIEYDRVTMEATDEDAMSLFSATCEDCPAFPGVQGAIFSDVQGKISFVFGEISNGTAEDVARAMWEIFELEVIDAGDENAPAP